ncbi:putative Exo-beta-1,3-glucanae [Pseudomassariella vexata]|uniref:Putative Exo-beta-1,3-glucanae n=1 Tax=Pseudomassariella vexata TaxID=1141098 RepID=A0A1Y2ECA8_9PEZI|nr:putative Exo-beta-1,3-glucanae [Pseudomassariella vexata]ORY68475.1 putative Exo-beta-1,3-glucanae [Pseudomassariella vexata]
MPSHTDDGGYPASSSSPSGSVTFSVAATGNDYVSDGASASQSASRHASYGVQSASRNGSYATAYPTASRNGTYTTSSSAIISSAPYSRNVSSWSSFSSVSRSTSVSFSSSTATSSTSSTPSACAYWLEDMKAEGIASFNADPNGYKVFRNVKDFGAKGDGMTDDTAAINAAISSGDRCGPGTCASSTTTPALVYFPNGTYLISDSIVDYYYTQIVGNPNCMPVIKASSGFSARWVIDGNKYGANGLGWGATNVFWRQIRNLVIDMTSVSPSLLVSGIHWPTAQATSLENIVVKMSTVKGTQHEGLFVEEGSGGFMNDLVFDGGLHGMTVGNQQFTMRNLTFNNAVTAIQQLWDWGWTYKGVKINNCETGLNMSGLTAAGAQNVGSVVFIDSEISNTPVGISMSRNTTSTPASGGSLILENVVLNKVPVAVQGPGNTIVLAGSSGASRIDGWGQGRGYTPEGPNVFQGPIVGNDRPARLTTGSEFYERSKPRYEQVPSSQFVSIRAAGAKGDGKTDDTDAINSALALAAAAGKIVFFNAGYYKVTKTIVVPPGSKAVGEAFPVIMSSGPYFADMAHPQVVVQFGLPGQSGVIEWSDMVISSQGAQAGAILIEWNLASHGGAPSGMWDVHTRVGGFTGSKLQVAECLKTPNTTITPSNIAKDCIAAFMSMHITKSASGLYMENCWLWVADHDIDDAKLTQITIYAGRGLLIESIAGGIWLYGTGVEHHVLYEYQLVNTKDVVMGQIQTETAYYQPNPDATNPFPVVSTLHDPVIAKGASGWGLRVVDSSDVLVYGAGLYSFFTNNNVECSNQGNASKCQSQILSFEKSKVSVYNLNTVGATSMATIDGHEVASWADNQNGFVSTVALLRI